VLFVGVRIGKSIFPQFCKFAIESRNLPRQVHPHPRTSCHCCLSNMWAPWCPTFLPSVRFLFGYYQSCTYATPNVAYVSIFVVTISHTAPYFFCTCTLGLSRKRSSYLCASTSRISGLRSGIYNGIWSSCAPANGVMAKSVLPHLSLVIDIDRFLGINR